MIQSTTRKFRNVLRKPSVESALGRVGLYRYLRPWYYRLSPNPVCKARLQYATMYQQFVRPGDLVFDVGANLGDRTECFLGLGARVVAVEPEPNNAAAIQRRYRCSRLCVEEYALGAEQGTATLHLSADCSMCTVSDERVTVVEESERLNSIRWLGTVEVSVLPLQDLIKRHGVPAFTKIDVEGYEPQVIAGLRSPLPMLSIEYVPEMIDAAHQCVTMLKELGDYTFNISRGETMRFHLDDWVDHNRILDTMDEVCAYPGEGHGDVYAKLSC